MTIPSRDRHPAFGSSSRRLPRRKGRTVATIAGVSIGATALILISVVLGSADMLGVLFIGLKLTHNIAWPWVLVLMPYIAQATIGIVVIVVFAIAAIFGIKKSWL